MCVCIYIYIYTHELAAGRAGRARRCIITRQSYNTTSMYNTSNHMLNILLTNTIIIQ